MLIKDMQGYPKLVTVQWNLHKTDTIGEQPFGRYIERWSSLRGFESQPQYAL